jgi:hypothetical protein
MGNRRYYFREWWKHAESTTFTFHSIQNPLTIIFPMTHWRNFFFDALADIFILNSTILYYFFLIISISSYVCIGLCGPGFPLMGALVGDCAGSFAISSNGGSYGADGHWQRNGLPGGFGTGDVVGFGMLLLPFEGSRLFFTKNGQLLGNDPYLSDFINKLVLI